RAGNFLRVARLAPGEQRSVELGAKESALPLEALSRQLSDRMAESLVSKGLYPREARAMVNTWKDSWFEEDGLRVLYVLPRAWTDRTLPIKMDPAPRDVVRVMVGRAEIIPPEQQEKLRNAITRAEEGDDTARAVAITEFQKLGRFSAPALGLAMRNAPQPVAQLAWTLLQAANKPQATPAVQPGN